jgi:hypothetical protein
MHKAHIFACTMIPRTCKVLKEAQHFFRKRKQVQAFENTKSFSRKREVFPESAQFLKKGHKIAFQIKNQIRFR